MTATVDVIVPNYNYSHFVGTCLASIGQQAGIAIRVILLDDGSTYRFTAEWIEQLPKDVTVEVRSHRFNRGHIYTYNEGLRLVQAPYYMLISPDDELLRGGASRLIRALERHPDASFAFSPAYTGPHRANITGMIGALGMEAFSGRDAVLIPGHVFRRHLSNLWFNPVPTPAVLVRTEAQRKAGGYLYSHPSAGDLEMWLRLSEVGPVVYVPEATAFYRQHPESMQQEYLNRHNREPIHLARAYIDRGIPSGVRTITNTLGLVAVWHSLALGAVERKGLPHVSNSQKEPLTNCVPSEGYRNRLVILAASRYSMIRRCPGKFGYPVRRLFALGSWPTWRIVLTTRVARLYAKLPAFCGRHRNVFSAMGELIR